MEPIIKGVAIYYDILNPERSSGGFREWWAPGSLIWYNDVRLNFHHHNSLSFVLARMQDESLMITADSKGLYYAARPDDSVVFHRLIPDLARGRLGASVGFEFLDYDETPDRRRYVYSARLIEITLCKDPVFRSTIGKNWINFPALYRDYRYDPRQRAMWLNLWHYYDQTRQEERWKILSS